MKLRNKKTGEIRNAVDIDMYTDSVYLKVSDGEFDNETIKYHSLAELNEEWEDYEEPKEYYWVDYDGKVKTFLDLYEWQDKMKEIGNYFETKEEAEKAVEKLKAWKRLKDKGFDIEGWNNHIGDNYYKTGQIVINLNNVKNRDWDEYDNIGEIKNELDLLFGGEDE